MDSVRLPLRPSYPIRLERVALRPFVPSDFEAVHDMQSRPELVRYLMWDVMDRDAVQAGIEIVAEAGMDAIRAKGIALTEYAIALTDDLLATLGCTVGSPRDSSRRGAHVAIRHAEARRLTRQMIDRGVIPDFRAPDSIRIGLSPLSTSFADVHAGISAIRDLL
ncbi:MAG: hypothetical protein ABUL57_00850, partial [Chloroflexota bacterium]